MSEGLAKAVQGGNLELGWIMCMLKTTEIWGVHKMTLF